MQRERIFEITLRHNNNTLHDHFIAVALSNLLPRSHPWVSKPIGYVGIQINPHNQFIFMLTTFYRRYKTLDRYQATDLYTFIDRLYQLGRRKNGQFLNLVMCNGAF